MTRVFDSLPQACDEILASGYHLARAIRQRPDLSYPLLLSSYKHTDFGIVTSDQPWYTLPNEVNGLAIREDGAFRYWFQEGWVGVLRQPQFPQHYWNHWTDKPAFRRGLTTWRRVLEIAKLGTPGVTFIGPAEKYGDVVMFPYHRLMLPAGANRESITKRKLEMVDAAIRLGGQANLPDFAEVFCGK